ncbi:MAG TPA: hypothetical protein EYM84_05590 [Flavobacteriales bacterium]|nr:hypothetical protein [Flavobacteriales bacterium]HIN39726.1 hypothetical protein [Flavobacteriales bacterium]
MKVYRFRVLLQNEDEDIFRDIDVQENHTLEEFHDCIQTAFEFDNSQMASFYLSDAKWNKGEEFTLFDMNEGDSSEDIKVMKDTIIGAITSGAGDRLVYIFDFMNVWKFYIEFVQILPMEPKIKYPAIINVEGNSPKQYDVEMLLSDDEEEISEVLKSANRILEEDLIEDDSFDDYNDYN